MNVEPNILFAVHEGAPFVGHDGNDHNLLPKGRPLIMRFQRLSHPLRSTPQLIEAEFPSGGSSIQDLLGWKCAFLASRLASMAEGDLRSQYPRCASDQSAILFKIATLTNFRRNSKPRNRTLTSGLWTSIRADAAR